ncbi:ATP-binding protein [Tenuifilum osseticum]|uniref:ATP-binding protein n=1 Tax=Tenuifilum osseticum TaxID=3374723 RepID=UPI0034E59A92
MIRSFFWKYSLLILLFFSLSYSGFTVIPSQEPQGVDEIIKLAREYENAGNANQAVYYYDKAANAYWRANDYQNAIEYFEKALENITKVGNKNGEKLLYINLGLVYSEISDYTHAQKCFESALNIATSSGKKGDVGQILYNISTVQIEQGNYQGSLSNLTKTEAIAQEVGDQKLLRNVYYNYNRAYEGLRNTEKAAEYFSLYAMLTKKIQAEEIRKKELQAKAMVDSAGRVVQQVSQEKEHTEKRLVETSKELKEKEQTLKEVEELTREQQMQIELLNAEMKLRDAVIQHQKLLQKVYIGLILFSLAFAAALYYAYVQKRRANRLLKEKNDEISRQRDAISRQADELRELNALKDKLFSIIAHDLRSPLFSLITMLNIAKEGHFTPENFKEILDELSVNVNHTTALLENLLTWAKTQMHGVKVNPQNFDLNQMVNSRIQLLTEAAENKEIKLKNSIPDGTFVFADTDMTDIVIRNLISNAIKFCNAGDRITIWSTTGADRVTVCVEDTGRGMTPDVLQKLFGTQITSTPGTKNEKGTGLGLILCKEFVQMNGGEIWAESQPDKGSKFFFTLPKASV